MTNEILVLFPYWRGVWAFDDENVGLMREPFVNGMPEMIDDLVVDIPNAKNGFQLFFSKAAFPGFQKKLSKTREEYGGWWYVGDDGKEGWLCAALFKYFTDAPSMIYVKAEAIKK